MTFVEYLIDSFKRAGFFIVGFMLLPIGSGVAFIGAKSGEGALPTLEPNAFSSIAGLIVIIIGFAMIGYAWRSRN